MTTILALDQSTQCTGYAYRDDTAYPIQQEGYHWGILKTPTEKKRNDLSPQKWQIEAIRELLKRTAPDVIVLEGVQVTSASKSKNPQPWDNKREGMNIKTALLLSEFRGRIIGLCEDAFGIPVMTVTSADMSSHLHLAIGAPRTIKKARSQYMATVMTMGSVYASDGRSPLVPEDAADALNILAIAEGRWQLEQRIKEAQHDR